jgi:crotonobetaine/carnitine-CoA ligase
VSVATQPDAERGATDRACLEALRLPRAADTLDALFRARVQAAGDALFLMARGRAHSWRDLDRRVDACGDLLVAAGLRRGDRVAAALPNGDALVLLLLACARRGFVFAPINPALTAGELAPVLAVLDAAALITTDLAEAVVSQVIAGLRRAPWWLAVPAGSLELGEAVARATIASPREATPAPMLPPQPDEPLAIVFTSGTTGVPKGAVHTHRTYVAAAQIAAWRVRLSPADTVLAVLPMFHLNALFYSVGGAIASGARLVLEERFSAATFWPTVNRHGVTQVNMIAAVGNILLKRDRAEFPGNPTLRKVSAAPVSQAAADALREAFGITHVVESYGMTEAPGVAQVDFDDTTHRACLGRPIRHPLSGEPVSEIRIVDEARRPLPAGAVGRIMLRSRLLMRGYFNRSDLASAIDAEGWFLTEDMGRMDEEGYAWLVGRTAEIVRCRGENVSVAEVEAALLTHPEVSEAACVGVPAELGEEELLAVVVPRPGARPSPASIAAHCARLLAPFKRPRWLVLRNALPRTPTEKVSRHLLRSDANLLREATAL